MLVCTISLDSNPLSCQQGSALPWVSCLHRGWCFEGNAHLLSSHRSWGGGSQPTTSWGFGLRFLWGRVCAIVYHFSRQCLFCQGSGSLCVHFRIVYIVTNQALWLVVSSAAASLLLDTFHPTPFSCQTVTVTPSWRIASKVLTENLSFGLWIILQPPSSHPKYLVFLPTSIQPLVAFPQPIVWNWC